MSVASLSPTTALVYGYADMGMDRNNTNIVFITNVLYFGIGIPGGYTQVQVNVTIPFPASAVGMLTTIQTAIAAAIRSDATSRGVTIPASGVLVSPWVAL